MQERYKTVKFTPEQELLTDIYELLYYLGLRATRTNFFHLSFAVYIATKNPDRMLSMTKWLYPDVAEHYATSWQAVERNIRTAVNSVWRRHRAELCSLAGYEIEHRPTATRFIRILVNALQEDNAA